MSKTGEKVLKEEKKERVGRVDHENLGGSDDSFEVFQVDKNGSFAYKDGRGVRKHGIEDSKVTRRQPGSPRYGVLPNII